MCRWLLLMFAAILLSLSLSLLPFPKPVRGRVLQIWLNPKQLATHSIPAADVLRAITPSRLITPGAAPDETMAWRGAFLLEVSFTPASPFLWTPEVSGNIILRATPEGEIVRLKDVARLRLRARGRVGRGTR